MHGYISDLHWVMPQCTYLLCTVFILYVESHNWVNAKNLISCEFPNDWKWHCRFNLSFLIIGIGRNRRTLTQEIPADTQKSSRHCRTLEAAFLLCA